MEGGGLQIDDTRPMRGKEDVVELIRLNSEVPGLW